MRWLLVTLVMVGVGTAGCIGGSPEPPGSAIVDERAVLFQQGSDEHFVFAPANCQNYLFTRWGNCNGPWPLTWIEQHERFTSIEGILDGDAVDYPFTGASQVVNWTVYPFNELAGERGTAVAWAEGTLPLELSTTYVEMGWGKSLQHVVQLMDPTHDLEARHLGLEVVYEVEVDPDRAINRTLNVTEIDYVDRIETCVNPSNQSCLYFPALSQKDFAFNGILKNLTLKVEWDAALPTGEILGLVLRCQTENGRGCFGNDTSVRGQSPLQLDIPRELQRGSRGQLTIEVQGNYIQTPQDFHVVGSFEHWSLPSARTDRWID